MQLDLAARLRARRRASPAEFVATLELQERRYKEVWGTPLLTTLPSWTWTCSMAGEGVRVPSG